MARKRSGQAAAEEQALLDGIRAALDDDAPRLRYARTNSNGAMK